MQFIDEATIEVEAGNGGPGAVSFRREKFIPMGGPDGGNGGAGGSVVVIADRNRHTLLDLRFHPRWKAQNGEAGAGRQKDGRSGEDLRILVPVGTQIVLENGEVVADLEADAQEVIIAKGGRGGKGNNFFKSSTNQAPRHAQPGETGERGTFTLSLKLVADVGLIGFPNAGKSTLISRISAARPKIADYPFTTLVPNLGLVREEGRGSFVVADIPGLIPDAHLGKGLGIRFLKHVERTAVLAHLVDPNQLDESGEPYGMVNALKAINHELTCFSDALSEKEQLIVVTKADTLTDQSAIDDVRKFADDHGYGFIVISSVSGTGIPELIHQLMTKVEAARESL